MAKEYGFKVYASDLWSDPDENQKFFSPRWDLQKDEIIAVKADAENLDFDKNTFFDAVISTDSYNYFWKR
ncbi:MAG: class I SAM-dependent methyltransferase [Clostridiales bacterium]|nr:MAG: class I SAM-dependent methyltransferase [Clostridiales bacterium]